MTGTHGTVTMINDDREGNNNNKDKLSCECLVCLLLGSLLLQFVFLRRDNEAFLRSSPLWYEKENNNNKQTKARQRLESYRLEPHREKLGTKSNSPFKYSIVKTGCWPSPQRILTSEHLLIAERKKMTVITQHG